MADEPDHAPAPSRCGGTEAEPQLRLSTRATTAVEHRTVSDGVTKGMTNAAEARDDLERAGERADRSPWLDRAARFGLVAYGVVYVLVAWVAAQLALGIGNGRPSTQGALAELASQPLGHVLLWAVAVGLFLLVVWRLVEASFGHRDKEGGKRVRARLVSLAKGVVYGAIGVNAVRIAAGGKASSSRSSKTFTARVLDLPAGQWIVALVGLAILAYGARLVWRGWTDGFLEGLDAEGRSGDAGTAYTWLGRVGYVAKGIAFGIVGVLFGYAAIHHDPKKAGGLDQALRDLLHQPFGPVLLLVIAVGIGCFGLFCFARARHLSR
jgi:hypothetical protein